MPMRKFLMITHSSMPRKHLRLKIVPQQSLTFQIQTQNFEISVPACAMLVSQVWLVGSLCVSFVGFGLVLAVMVELARLLYHLTSFCKAADQFDEFVEDLHEALERHEETPTILGSFVWRSFNYAFKEHLSKKLHHHRNHTDSIDPYKLSTKNKLKTKIVSKMLHVARNHFTPDWRKSQEDALRNGPGYLPWFNLDREILSNDPEFTRMLNGPYLTRRRVEASRALKFHATQMMNSWLLFLGSNMLYVFSCAVLQLRSAMPVSMVILAQLIMRLIVDFEASCILMTKCFPDED
eukprot:TRINITY_DN18587_c0_g2_i1.p1 TRINITY_DN18587_c0_g2~~TRINITY_DN18587_c0_g2_i1.p1  ORF type:complete len:293 (-),score=35.55 TRINITY_DN18587_c0_g2_i1:25-903(-)